MTANHSWGHIAANRPTAKPPPATTNESIRVYSMNTHRVRENPTGEINANANT